LASIFKYSRSLRERGHDCRRTCFCRLSSPQKINKNANRFFIKYFKNRTLFSLFKRADLLNLPLLFVNQKNQK